MMNAEWMGDKSEAEYFEYESLGNDVFFFLYSTLCLETSLLIQHSASGDL